MNDLEQKWIIRYFKDWKNILTFIFLILLVAAGFYLRIRNLGYLAFWGDDGHTVIGTLSILRNGYPLLPSGFVLFHSILDYYLNVIPVLIFGPTEFAFRLTSVVFGCGTILMIYFTGKEMVNKFAGFLAATIITFSSWYIYFSREARYFSVLQFFFLISIYFFYKGFVKEEKPFRILATVFFILAPLVHGNAFFLIFAFIALIFYMGKKFFRSRSVLIPFIIILVLYLLQILNQVFFWRVGRSFFAESGDAGGFIGAYFRIPDPYYFKILNIIFPRMLIVFIIGTGVFIGLSIFMSLKKTYKYSNLYLNENELRAGKARFPFNVFLLYFVFTLSILIISFGQMYNQQRYIYFLMPLFILIFVYTVYVLSFTAAATIRIIYQKISKKGLRNSVFVVIFTVIFLAISVFTVSGIDLKEAYAIPSIKHSDKLNTNYSISTVISTHYDAATPGKYVASNMQVDDIVITTDVYNSYPYTGKIDYWLWSGNLKSWQPYHLEADGKIRDDTYGVEVIRDIYSFMDVLNKNNDKNVWLIASHSINIPEHVDPLFGQFLEERQDNLVLTARDNIARLYYFPKTPDADRISIKDFIVPGPENTLVPDINGILYIDFTDPENASYLVAGWGDIEENIGTWGIGNISVLYMDFNNNKFDIGKKSTLVLIAKPLPHPELMQTLEIIVNGSLVDRIELVKTEDFGLYSVDINPDMFSEETSVLEFRYSYSFTPLELDLGPDSRNLSVMFKSLEITNKD
jgi:4-amino-4-deoxy-L-arabinose transferase-like glycosyltransferase